MKNRPEDFAGEAPFFSKQKVMEKRAEEQYRDMVGKLYSLESLQQITRTRDRCRRDLESSAAEKTFKP